MGDGGVESSSADLSGYFKLIGNNTTICKQLFKLAKNTAVAEFYGQLNSYGYSFTKRNREVGDPTVFNDWTIRAGNGSPSENLDEMYFFTGEGNVRRDLTWSLTTGIFDFKQTPTINGIPIGSGSGTVTSITPAFGFTSTTPITTTGTLTIDTAQVQAKLNETNFGNFMDVGLSTKLTPSSGDFLLGRDIITNEAVEIPFSTVEAPLTFTSPLSRSVNTISIPAATSSVSGHLTSTDWNTFNNKQNTISFGGC